MILPVTDLDLRALKTVTGELVTACGGTSAVSALLSTPGGGRVAESRISAYGTHTDMTRFVPVDRLLRMEIACGQPILSGFMSRRLVRDGSGSAGALVVSDLGSLIRQTGDLNCVVSEALSDGAVSSNERAAIRADIIEMRRVLDDLERKVAQP